MSNMLEQIIQQKTEYTMRSENLKTEFEQLQGAIFALKRIQIILEAELDKKGVESEQANDQSAEQTA